MKNRVLFYSSVKYKKLFNIQRFYHTDIELIHNLGYDVFLSNKISDFLCFWKYDIAFIYFYKFGLFPAIISRVLFKKVFFTGGIDNLEKKVTKPNDYMIQKIFFKLCYLFSTNCILVSTSDEHNVRNIYNGKLPKRTFLSYHTIDVDNFKVNDSYHKENIFSTIAWMENIENVYRKGVDKSIEVFKGLSELDEYVDSKFYIIGKEGDGSDYLKKLCLDFNIVDKVIFTGSIDEEQKIEILKRSKYYFQLSLYEGFGIAALEALAAKNIVIHSGNGGLKDVIKNFGIKVDIDTSVKAQVDFLYSKILSFNSTLLADSYEYVKENFSNYKRQNDLKQIFKI